MLPVTMPGAKPFFFNPVTHEQSDPHRIPYGVTLFSTKMRSLISGGRTEFPARLNLTSSPMSRFSVFRMLAGALILFSAGPVCADAWRDIPYERLHRALTTVTPLPDARYVRIRQRVAVPDTEMAFADLRIVIAAASGDIEVPITPGGDLDFPISDALLKENPPVRVNAPEGKLSISVQLDAAAPPAQRFPYAMLEELTAEYGRLVKLQGLMARMAAPKPVGLEVRFPPGPSASAIVRGTATTTIMADSDGRLVIPSNRKWRAEGAEIELSRMPEAIGLAFRD